MSAQVAVVAIDGDYQQALGKAIDLIGGIAPLNTAEREVTVKIGLFDPRQHHHASVEAVGAIAAAFDQAPRVLLAESDSYGGEALFRLQRFCDLFSERVAPFSLSNDPLVRMVQIAGGEMGLAHVLFKPNVLVSTHVMRTFIKGSILKNLFGCTPMVQKGKFHKAEIFYNQLCDIFELAGGIDLAVLDGRVLFHAASEKQLPMNLLVVGRDAVAVETVGATLAGLKPEKMEVIQAFVQRGLGEGNMKAIEILGASAAEWAELKKLHKGMKALVEESRKKGTANTIDALIAEGWLDTPRTAQAVAEALQQRGVESATKPGADATLKRRLGKGLERGRGEGGWVYWRKANE